MWQGSKHTVIPNVVAMPSFAWQYINSVPAAGTSGSFQRSVLDYLMENNLSKAKGVNLQIVSVYDADTVANGGLGLGASAASRTVYYRKTDQDLVQHVPMPLRFLAPEQTGRTYWGGGASAPITKPPSRRTTMPTIRNFALHAFDFPRTKRDDKGNPIAGNVDKLSFPAGVNAGNGKVQPSLTEIDDAALAELKDHDTAGDWFGPDALVVEGTPRYTPEAREKFRAESSSPTMPWGSGPRPDGFAENVPGSSGEGKTE